ncbi:hypothetical protein MMC31_002329 [Peltigera leucophlebia]|nr:hypothetical protein [Peltigera leucophlebia]
MAPGSRLCQSPCRNLPPVGEVDKLAGPPSGPTQEAFTVGSDSPAPSRIFTPASTTAPFSNKELFKQFMQTYMETVKNQGQNQAGPQEHDLWNKIKRNSQYQLEEVGIGLLTSNTSKRLSMTIASLSSLIFRFAQELSTSPPGLTRVLSIPLSKIRSFRIDYPQGMANGGVNASSRFHPRRSESSTGYHPSSGLSLLKFLLLR